jgi:hypothetical protein
MNKPLEPRHAAEHQRGRARNRPFEGRIAHVGAAVRFPKPGRDDNGERQYTVAEIAKLRSIKRLMDVGMRPGKIIALSQEELNAMADARTAIAATRFRRRSSTTS